MIKFKTSINSVKDVRMFTEAALHCTGDVDVKQGRYTVDGKSVVGIFSIDLENDFQVILSNDEDRKFFAGFINS